MSLALALICSAIPWLARPLHVWLLVIALVVGVTLGLLGAVLAVPPSLWTDLVVVLVVAWSGGLLLGRGMAPRFCPVLLVFLCLSVLDVLLAVGGYPQAPWTVASSSPLVYTDFLLVLPWGRFAITLVDLLLITALAEHWRRRGGGYLLALLPFGEDEGAAHFVRRQWHDGQWFFSVVDVVRVLTDSPNPRNYWSMLKRKLHDEGASESYTKCVQLKMRSLDGKNYATDAADVETMLRIVQTIPSPRVEPIKQWLAKVGRERLEEIAENRDLLAGMTEDQRRLFLHGQVADRNTTLTETAAGVGVVTARDFALFQDWGYRGLYGGETARDIAARKGLGRGEKVLDWMGPEELGDNLFRILQTEAKLRRDATEGVTGKGHAHATHHAVGREARATIERLGGTMPEDLPTPAESVKQLERKEQKRIEAERQPSLFPADTDTEGGD